jgi:glycosyltransferase involved in cell wall biosynthesis
MYVEALRRAGHYVTYAVPNSYVGHSNVIRLPSRPDARYQLLANLSNTHDVVVIQSYPNLEYLTQHPSLLHKALLVDHHAHAVPDRIRDHHQLVRSIVSRGFKYVTTDVTGEGYTGILINQCVPFDRAPLQDVDSKLLIACGRMVPIKKLDIAAQAMIQLREHGYRGIIVTNDIPQRFNYDVDIRTNVPHSHVMQLLAQASCLIQPSIAEKNGSCVAFEAASHGTPVVHYITNADYFLVPTQCSRKIATPTVDAVVQAVLTNQPVDRLVARQWCDTHFNETLFVKRLEVWLDHVCGGPLPC